MITSTAPVQNLIVNAQPLDPLIVGKEIKTLLTLVAEQGLIVDALDGIKREIVIDSIYWIWGDGLPMEWGDDEVAEQT